MPNWPETFTPWTVQHLLCVAVCAVIMLGVSLVGLRLRGRPKGDDLRLAVAWLGVAYWIVSNIWWNVPRNFNLQQSLPIQICDIAGLLGPLALATRNRTLLAILYFWGIGLSSQGFFQPVVTVGTAYTEFWLFWANHTIIVGTALYAVLAMDYRPTWRDFRIAVAALGCYFVVIFPFDVALHLNYGYVGDVSQRNPATILGPWPLRIIPLALIAVGVLALLELPWTLTARRRDAQSLPPA